MVNILIAVGIVFVVLAVWKGRNQSARERQELDELKMVRDELLEAKKEVGSLLHQLEAVSEKVVEEISTAVEEARRPDTMESAVLDGGQTDDSEQSKLKETGSEDIPQNPDQAEHKAILSDDDAYDDAYDDGYDDDDDDDDASDDEAEEAMDEELPELIVELTGKPKIIKTNNTEFRNSHPGKTGVQVYAEPRKTNIKPAAAGKTILFPRKMENFTRNQAAVKHSVPVPEAPPKHQMVYAMAKMGYQEEEIAKQMDIGRGEVRLILQLKRKGEEANG